MNFCELPKRASFDLKCSKYSLASPQTPLGELTIPPRPLNREELRHHSLFLVHFASVKIKSWLRTGFHVHYISKNVNMLWQASTTYATFSLSPNNCLSQVKS